jgi:simple sugar transport system ATP-binding protein
MSAALELEGVHKSFDGNPVLVDAFFSATWGEVHALLGENGAGKSSLMNIACGLYAPDVGAVKIDGRAVSVDGPPAAQALGIGMVHQHFKLVSSMTVAENIVLGHGRGSWRRSLKWVREEIAAIGGRIGFAIDPDARIDALSVSEQQRVEIVKAMIGGARILILDEPTAVLTDEESTSLLTQLKVFARGSACVVLITHKLREVFGHADRVTVMRGGRTVEAGRAPAGYTPELLSRLMVGEARDYEASEHRPPGPCKLDLVGLRVRREGGGSALDGLSLSLCQGQVYGLAGVGGNGQTELAEVLMGLRALDDGELALDGVRLARPAPRDLRRLGLACIPAERYLYGLAGDLTVMDNYVISHLGRGGFGSWAWVDRRAIERETAGAIEAFNIQGAGVASRARLLSGGNAQKLVLARELTGEPSVLLAHSPTRGLDVRACAAVHRALREAGRRGAAVLLLSEDLDEVLSVSDRIGVINRGRIVGEFDAPADRQEIGRLMVGHA